MHSDADRGWLAASPTEAHRHNASLDGKAYVDNGFGASDEPLPPWVGDLLDSDAPLDVPDGLVMARFVRDLPSAVADNTERRRVMRAALLAAAGRLGSAAGDGQRGTAAGGGQRGTAAGGGQRSTRER
jgi:hypothetical protein